ncbi:hypothetical protein Dsin_017910 [Dipteronia sinensis]|uniref:SHSP domain-containing protein n=1 Tax=Dipteronia sinensis TaxID=43782 RepID=A0AAE0AFZ3_9ROSI|nr:hypothetical protein Dsin_017910 [Dipteronia sinensis]
MERRVGKFMRKFVLPENANTDSISAVCQDGVLTVTVEKLPPPEPKKPMTIEINITLLKLITYIEKYIKHLQEKQRLSDLMSQPEISIALTSGFFASCLGTVTVSFWGFLPIHTGVDKNIGFLRKLMRRNGRETKVFKRVPNVEREGIEEAFVALISEEAWNHRHC